MSAALDPRREAPDDEVGRLVGDFLDSLLSPRTRSSYATDLALYLRWLGVAGVHPLRARRPQIDRFRNHLTELVGPDGEPSPSGRPRYAPSTVSRRLSAVRSFYTYLTDQQVLGASPAVGVKTPTVAKEPGGKGLKDEHLRRLLDAAAAAGPDAEAIVCLLALNGLRVSEVCGAEIEDLRREPGDGRSLRVRGKGGKEVWVPLNARTERAVIAAADGRSNGPIVRRPADRRRRAGSVAPLRPFNRQAIYRRLVELATTANLLGEGGDIDKLHPHVLRHSFVTLLLDGGVPLAAVQDAARHASPETTRLYDRSRSAFTEHPTHTLTFGS
jgi:site-specific recombinase XerD